MKKKRADRARRGQAMTEFVIALPILLFLIFGIIEFARLTFAWMAVQNAARFGIRYAVTGEFKPEYCDEAGNYLGTDHINADTDGGDPQDCLVPESYSGGNGGEKEKELIDIARLFSIRDAAEGGGQGLWLRPSVSGDYYQYLSTHNVSHVGQVDEEGFFHITICSNREGQYAMDRNNYAIPLCVDNLNGVLMDDAGGPGDRVKVHVEHRHPLFLPLLTSIWPNLGLNAERDGIVEKFRTSRVLGVSGPIMSAPTWTQTPTITPTPTVTDTPPPTATYTPVPTAFTCSGSGILREYWTGISGSNLSDLTGNANYPLAPSGNSIQGSFEAPVDWNDNYGTRMRAWLCIPQPGNYEFWIASDDDSTLLLDCSGTDPLIVGDANPGGAGQIAFVNGWTSSQEWDKYSSQRSAKISVGTGGWNCYIEAIHKEGGGRDNLAVAWNGPHIPSRSIIDSQYLIPLSAAPTQLPTATPTITPTPDCSAYSMGNFSFSNYAIQEMTVTNNDIVDAEISRIILDWSYAEQFGQANGYANLNVDWFRWDGSYIWGGGNGGSRDYGSSTDSSVDASSSWNGPKPFNAGSSYSLQVDFDGDWGGGGPLTNVTSSDFGISIHFTNGCQLNRAASPQPIITWTPTNTPTITPTPTASPVPTSTFTATITPTASDTPPPSDTPTPSDTPPPPTATDTQPPPTNTPLPTDTPAPSDTPEPTSTSSIPSDTPTPLPSATPSPTYYFD